MVELGFKPEPTQPCVTAIQGYGERAGVTPGRAPSFPRCCLPGWTLLGLLPLTCSLESDSVQSAKGSGMSLLRAP